MPFFNQIASYINDQLRAGSLNKKKLQPANYLGISTIVGRKKNAAQKDLEQLPAIVASNGKATVITPDDKYAIQIYHKLLTNVYSYEKKSYGDDHDIKSSTEVSMVVIANSKLTGVTTDVLEPVVLFGIPQHLSDALMAELKLNKCLITPIASNMDAISVFKQEFPQSAHFLNTQMSMFLIRYKIEMTFSQSCVEKCLCE
jgi:hypothetical protein